MEDRYYALSAFTSEVGYRLKGGCLYLAAHVIGLLVDASFGGAASRTASGMRPSGFLDAAFDLGSMNLSGLELMLPLPMLVLFLWTRLHRGWLFAITIGLTILARGAGSFEVLFLTFTVAPYASVSLVILCGFLCWVWLRRGHHASPILDRPLGMGRSAHIRSMHPSRPASRR